LYVGSGSELVIFVFDILELLVFEVVIFEPVDVDAEGCLTQTGSAADFELLFVEENTNEYIMDIEPTKISVQKNREKRNDDLDFRICVGAIVNDCPCAQRMKII
jgi:hypothetical protein